MSDPAKMFDPLFDRACRRCKKRVPVEGTKYCPPCTINQRIDEKNGVAHVGRDLAISLTVAAVLVCAVVGGVIYGAVALVRTAGSAGAADSRCSELKDWYEDAPYDSNRTIARDYWRHCNEVPPPVVNGELTMSDITG